MELHRPHIGMPLSPADLAHKYFVDDLPGATVPGARLRNILVAIEGGQEPSTHALAFLAQRGLLALHDLARGLISPDIFSERSSVERDARVAEATRQMAVEAAAVARHAEERDAAIQARFIEMENDPVLRRKREAKQLRERFGIGYVEADIYPRMMRLLQRVADGQPLSPEDVVWLSTDAEDCWTPELRSAHHRLQAAALTREWELTGDPWAAVNACAQWRKGEVPEEALRVTATVLESPELAPKLQSALRTTRGGAMRDLGRLVEARDVAHEAQRLAPEDFRPCTLLGAICTQQGDFMTGQEWYARAEELGADRHAIDHDLRAVLDRCAPDVRVALSDFLLSRDPERFAWARRAPGRKM